MQFAAWRRTVRVQLLAFVHDVCLIPVAWLGAYWLRYNLESIPEPMLEHALWTLPIVASVQITSFWYFGLYRGIWRFASLPDLMRIIKASSVGMLSSLLLFFLLFRGENMPRSVFPMYGLLLIVALGGSRFAFRWLKEQGRFTLTGKRVLIIGAGQAGESLARELLRNRQQGYVPVGFIDDYPRHTGRDIYGIRVLGYSDDIPQIASKYGIDVILIALPSAKAAEMRRLMALCEQTELPVRTLPAVGDILKGRVNLQQLREISIDDLLGRDPIRLDWHAIGEHLSDNSILVSGAGGSIGSELCRQILQHRPLRLIVIDNSEYNLFCLERELRQKIPANTQLVCRLVDVCDQAAVDDLFNRYHIDMIYHAAAYKHVPILESQVREAIRNNVLGTYCLARAAMHYRTRQFVLVSTDKAVNPTNVMGASKRIAERVCQALNPYSQTQFLMVRFGNVLGSRGSVVEIFKSQLEKGGPLTVTHPDVTRFFMTIPEASQLILQAATLSETGGEIYMLDMGESVSIRYLAEQMIKLSGKKLDDDIEIKYTGLRPGEKLKEELYHQHEALCATHHPKILRLKCREEFLSPERWIVRLDHACKNYDEMALIQAVSELVPEFEASTTASDAVKQTEGQSIERIL